MDIIRTRDWYYTTNDDPRGYIQPHTLRELWFHTGTACNLACDFCLEGSSPGDQRLQLIRFDDAKPYIDEALTLGVEQFSFTGGEPFLAKDIVSILAYASQYRPCLVLTNASEPLQRRFEQLHDVRNSQYPINFRVSLDYSDADRHDRGRGQGNFDTVLQGLRMLHQAGFSVSVARHMDKNEDSSAVEAAFRTLFIKQGIPENTRIVAFPDFSTPGQALHTPQITEHCMTHYHDQQGRQNFMCAFSKMMVKQNDTMHVYACTLVDDDPEYNLGVSLRESLDQRISMKHHRCYSCFAYGASCSES